MFKEQKQAIALMVGLTLCGVALVACTPPNDYADNTDPEWKAYRKIEAAANSKNNATGLVGTVAGCSVWRMANSGPGPDYIFFTKCGGDDVTTDFEVKTGKTRRDYQTKTVMEK